MELPDIRKHLKLRGLRVLLRASLNVPVVDGKVFGDFRLARSLETITYLKEQGAKVLIVGHIGREAHESLKPVYAYLQERMPIGFAKTLEEVSFAKEPMVLLENIRGFEGEKENSEVFAQALASLCDLYVNDAFSDSHRAHASVVGVSKFLDSYAGLGLLREVEELKRAENPEHPALCILGGAKFETKSPLIRKYLDSYDYVFVGGALAHDLFRAKGWDIGRSLSAPELLAVDDILNHQNLLLPQDVIVEGVDGRQEVKSPDAVGVEDNILDAGPKTIEALLAYASKARFVLWNGPLGNYEHGYNEQTENLAKGLASGGVPCIVGGGDTVASIASLNLIERFTFVSTGGGAMLEYLQNGTLPGIEALKQKK